MDALFEMPVSGIVDEEIVLLREPSNRAKGIVQVVDEMGIPSSLLTIRT
jgi:hypothetical protein